MCTIRELRFHFVIRDGVGSVENPTRDEQEIRSPAFRRVIEEETARPRN